MTDVPGTGRARWWETAAMTVAMAAGLATAAAGQTSTPELRGSTLEELLAVEVTTVSRVPQARTRALASIYVITQDDIRRSGATTIPETLRLVPGVIVERIDSSRWAIGIRGFPDRTARAMLVLIDGRAVYSPLFAGTYWEVQDTLMDDIERIEVVNGPGGTLWGANAVTGIINIITKSARDTQGGLIDAGTGSEERGFASLRFGGARGDDMFYRVYGKAANRGPSFRADGSTYDSWQMNQGGFRVDRVLANDRTLSVHGDGYKSPAGTRLALTSLDPPYSERVTSTSQLSGANVVARWSGRARGQSSFALQSYFDYTHRQELTFTEGRHTADVDFQYVVPKQRHQLIWGAGYRWTSSSTQSVETVRFDPSDRTDQLFSAFAQDEFQIVPDKVVVSFGAKVEHNDYSGPEIQPSARLLWSPNTTHTWIASATRAVRTPSRIEHDLTITSASVPSTPAFTRLVPNKDFASEKLIAYELSYRTRPALPLFVTATTFFNVHRDVLSTELGAAVVEPGNDGPRTVLPVTFGNGLHGQSYGLEVSTDYRVRSWWRWTGGYSFLRIQLTRDAGSQDASQERAGEGRSPRHQLVSGSAITVKQNWDLDWQLRVVSALRSLSVPAYATSDLRISWSPSARWELSLVGKDLHRAHHLEFTGGSAGNSEIQRSVYGKLSWRW